MFKPLSICKYYGGKADMAFLLADMLDYKTTNVFAEIFGGGCRTLLNKRRHEKEFYFEYSDCMRALVKMLLNKDTGLELIKRLHNTENTEECFFKYLKIKQEYEQNAIQYFFEDCYDINRYERNEKDYLSKKDYRYQLEQLKKELANLKRKMYNRLNSILLCIHDNRIDFDYAIKDAFKGKKNKKLKEKINKFTVLIESYNELWGFQDYNKIESQIKTVLCELDESYNTFLVTEFEYLLNSKVLIEPFLINYIKITQNEKERILESIIQFNHILNNYKENLTDLDVEYVDETMQIELDYIIERHENLEKHFKKPLPPLDMDKIKKQLHINKYKDNFFNLCFEMEFLDESKEDYDEMDMAVSAYVVYAQSRDGMGTAFAKGSFKSQDEYHRGINRLLDVVPRLDGVIVDDHKSSIGSLEMLMLNNENYMVYSDSPYLQDKNVTLENLKFYNPGLIYAKGWHVSNHIRFLEMIMDADCKLLVSGYTDINELYDKYLKKPKWNKLEYPTTTSMSGGKNSLRTECLWYNYELN